MFGLQNLEKQGNSDYDLLVSCMDKIISTSSFLESFEREANWVVVKYKPYSVKVNEVINFDWPTDEEYKAVQLAGDTCAFWPDACLLLFFQ